MPQKHVLFALIFVFIAFAGKTQDISVESFKVLPNDLDARVNYPVKDQNGEKCALIKVVTDQKGFVWEGGMLGITKVEKKTGEYWVYIPRGAKKITIKHDKLGVLRDYVFPTAIKKATVYEMVLTTGDVKTVVEEPEIESVWLMINSEPKGADVYIDDVYSGQTPFQKRLSKDKYNYRVSKQKYKSKAGVVDLTEIEDKKKLDLSLDPNFGTLKITSKPEQGAKVFIDGRNIRKKTPCTIEKILEGDHKIELRKKLYEPKVKQFSIQAQDTKSLNISMRPVYGTVSIHSTPDANIYIDNEKVGYGSKDKKLTPGVYKITARKEKHYTDERNIELEIGEERTIQLQPKPKYGEIDITTTPWEAAVYLDGKKMGTTPLTIDKLLVGNYTLKIQKEGYQTIEKQIEVEEGETFALKETLKRGSDPESIRAEKKTKEKDNKAITEKKAQEKSKEKVSSEPDEEKHIFCNFELGYTENWSIGSSYMRHKAEWMDQSSAVQYGLSIAKRLMSTESYNMHILANYYKWNYENSNWTSNWTSYRVGLNNQIKNFGITALFQKWVDDEASEVYSNYYDIQLSYSPYIELQDDVYLAFTPNAKYRLARNYVSNSKGNSEFSSKENIIIGKMGLVFIVDSFSVKAGFSSWLNLDVQSSNTNYLMFGVHYTF